MLYGQLIERLEADRGLRVCRWELWAVSHTGWQAGLPMVLQGQRLGSGEEQRKAVQRWRTLPRYVDTEIANLREGQRLGYHAPKRITQQVIEQLDRLLAVPAEQSPYYPEGAKTGTAELRATWLVLINESINPALKAYRDYLATEYLGRARESLSVAANPDGRECYQAWLRNFTTLNRSPEDTAQLGAARERLFENEAKQVARDRFGTDDLDALDERIRQDPARRFSSRDEALAFAQDALARGAAAASRMFGRLPRARVVIEPYAAFLEPTAAPTYRPAPADGSRPATFGLNLRSALSAPKANLERTTLHETFPGHHLEVGRARELPTAHVAARIVLNSAFSEGWARYAEGLAEEFGLFSEDYARIQRRRGRGVNMQVDPGIHVLGWTRDQAIQRLVASGGSRQGAELLVDRIAVLPAQTTAYDVGAIEFEALRVHARDALGPRFDLRAFHDVVLSVGPVPFPMLRTLVDRWIASTR